MSSLLCGSALLPPRKRSPAVAFHPSNWCGQLRPQGSGSVLISVTSATRTKGVRAACLCPYIVISTHATTAVATEATMKTSRSSTARPGRLAVSIAALRFCRVEDG